MSVEKNIEKDKASGGFREQEGNGGMATVLQDVGDILLIRWH